MALSITASTSCKTSFTLTQVNSNESISLVDSNTASLSYTYGSGDNQIKNAASITGILSSGGTTRIDLYGINQTTLNATQTIRFTGVKNLSVYNTSTTRGYDFVIAATGGSGCTNLFNGGSGNLLVKPYGCFSYSDPFTGFTVSSGHRYLYLRDLGSGVSYKMFVLGLD